MFASASVRNGGDDAPPEILSSRLIISQRPQVTEKIGKCCG